MGQVLILEDDATMHSLLESIISKNLSDLTSVQIIETEADFRLKWMPAFTLDRSKKPDIFIIDIMLRWTDPNPEQPPRPPDVIEGGFMRAGLRCLRLIRQHPTLSNVPVIILTTLTKKNLEDLGTTLEDEHAVDFLHKGDLEQLPARIRAALSRTR